MPPPLIARVEPIVGETLLSLAARAAHANVFPKLHEFLALAGVGGHPAFSPFTAADRARPLAELLGLPVEEVAQRFHPLHPDQRPKGAVVWAGVRMRRRSIESRVRRVAPQALKASPHHRLEWTHRALSFCPETLQQLISACPGCGAELGWVTTKGLDRRERCEASLAEADALMVKTRSPDRLRAAARLISPDAAVRTAAQMALPAEFHAWDAGDLLAALCEIGMAWRRPEEGREPATARAVADGGHRFQPEDIARGQTLLSEWPKLQGELLDRLAAGSSAHRTSGRLTSGRLGPLGRHLTPVSTGRTLGGLLMRAVDAEAEGRRLRAERAKGDEAALEERKVGSIGLVEACRAFGISRPVLSRLVPHGRSLISVQPRRRGGVRFDAELLERTIHTYNSSEGFTDLAKRLGVPRYCLPALTEAGVLDATVDPDVPLLRREGSVMSASVHRLRRALEAASFRSTGASHTLGTHLRRRFDPQVWAEAFRRTLGPGPICWSYDDDEADCSSIIDATWVDGDELYHGLPEDDPHNCPQEAELTATEAGRLLGLPAAHLPELFAIDLLPARRDGATWRLKLRDVMHFCDRFVTGTELMQRCEIAQQLTSPLPMDVEGAVSTRHFRIYPREYVEDLCPWPRASLR